MQHGKLPAPFDIVFLHPMDPLAESLRTGSRFHFCGKNLYVLDPLSQFPVRRADAKSTPALRADKIRVLDISLPEGFALRFPKDSAALITDHLHTRHLRIYRNRTDRPRGRSAHSRHHGQEVEIRNGEPDLQAPKEEQCRSYFPVTFLRFFLASTSVMRLVPQSSRISGSTS